MMGIKHCLFLVNLFAVSLFLTGYSVTKIQSKRSPEPENHAPVVKILSPKSNGFYRLDSQANYAISVSDAEDGDTKFQEIESNEVLLCVKYLSDSSKLAEVLNNELKNSGGLDEIRKSNCLNCHAFTGTLIGPSFVEISRRYSDTEVNRKRLGMNILNGLSGVWGSAVMPTHPELSKEKADQMIDWVLTSAADSTVSYFRGTEGAFRIKSPATLSKTGIFLITASYIDHGIRDKPDTNLKGGDSVFLKIQ